MQLYRNRWEFAELKVSGPPLKKTVAKKTGILLQDQNFDSVISDLLTAITPHLANILSLLYHCKVCHSTDSERQSI